MPFKKGRKDGKGGKKSAVLPILRRRLDPEELAFCEKIIQRVPVGKASLEMGHARNYGYFILKRPHVKAYLDKLSTKVEEEEMDRIAKRIAETLDLADDRLMEILSSKRINPMEMLLLSLGAKAAKKEPAKKGKVAPVRKATEIPVEDKDLLKAIDLAYKRRGGYPQEPSPAANAILQQNNIQTMQVYQSKWSKSEPPTQPVLNGNTGEVE